MTGAYRTEDADLDASAPAIQALWVANLAGHRADTVAAKYRLGYLENPAGPAAAVLLYPPGEAVPKGVQGLYPRVFHHGTRRLRALGLADYVVDPRHRSLGPALQLMRRSAQIGASGCDLMYGLPNKKAAPVLNRAGLVRVGMVCRYAKPLATRERLARPVPPAAAAVLAPLLDRLLRALDVARALRQRARLRCEPAAWGDAALDAAIEAIWAQRPLDLLLSDRSASMLRWRFAAEGRGAWRLCLARDAAGAPCGYVVWRLQRGVAHVGDFFSTDLARWTAPLMLAFSALARRGGARSVSVSFLGAGDVVRALRASGLALRQQDAPLFKLPGGPEGIDLDAPGRWYLTDFDNDSD